MREGRGTGNKRGMRADVVINSGSFRPRLQIHYYEAKLLVILEFSKTTTALFPCIYTLLTRSCEICRRPSEKQSTASNISYTELLAFCYT